MVHAELKDLFCLIFECFLVYLEFWVNVPVAIFFFHAVDNPVSWGGVSTKDQSWNQIRMANHSVQY